MVSLLSQSLPDRERRLCHYTVVKYVPNPLKGGAINIGVILICPELDFAEARFRLKQARLSPGSSLFRQLNAWTKGCRFLPPRTLPDLQTLSKGCSHLLQFAPPGAAIGQPGHLLETLYSERVLGSSVQQVSSLSGKLLAFTAQAIKY